MGMFDYVDVKVKCPKCNEMISDFQTKDEGRGLGTFKFEELHEGTFFYSSCPKCEVWIEFVVCEDKLGNRYAKTVSEEI